MWIAYCECYVRMVLRTVAIGNSNRNSKCSCLRAIRYSGSTVNAYFCICWVLTVRKAYALVISYACNLRFYGISYGRCRECLRKGITVRCVFLAFRLIDVNRYLSNIARVIIICYFNLHGMRTRIFTVRYFSFVNNANRWRLSWLFIILPRYTVTSACTCYMVLNIIITCSIRKRNSIANRFIFFISITNGNRHFNRTC
ncbi:Uncharacterised protein [Chlamydia trachomatis]|nr:Uncharacterised protein [Chlamydia trachomatis]